MLLHYSCTSSHSTLLKNFSRVCFKTWHLRLTSFEHDIVSETWFCGWKRWDFESQTFWCWCLVLMSGIYKIACLPIIHISELKHRMLKFEVWKKNVISVNYRVWTQNKFLKTANFKTCQPKIVILSLALQSDWIRDTLRHKLQDLPTEVCHSESCPAIWLDKRYTQPHPPHPISSPPSWKHRIISCPICAFFWQETGWGHTLEGSESKFDILYCSLATPWRLWFWHFAI